jgi:hypothetical protein
VKYLVTAAILALTAAPALAQSTPPAEAPAVTKAKAKADAAPAAADLLFERPQMRNAAPGATLTYDYLRRSGISKGPFGPPLNDAITLKLEPGKNADERNISVQMFSGQNRFPAGPFEDMPGNPVMTLFLEHHLINLARVLEANPRYLKNAIRKGLRDRATVTPTKVTYNGREVDGWRIEAKPFEGDKLAERMRGMSNMTYIFITSPEVPGELVSIEAQSKNPEGGELLEERLSYDQKAG